jgi:hypothetical protein
MFLMAAAVFTSACAGDRWVRTPVFSGDHAEVYLEHRVEDDLVAEQGYAHPCRIDSEVLAVILKGLVYEEHKWFLGEPDTVPVFFDREVVQLASALADALAQADANQRLRFTSYNMGGGLLFAARQKNEGVLFIKPRDRLNIAFSLINEELYPNEDYEPTTYRSRRDPLRIVSSSTPIRPTSWYSIHESGESGEKNVMWAVVDIGKPPGPVSVKTASRTPAGTERPKETVKPSSMMESAPARPGEQEDKIRQGLAFLKELFESGLITEQEYEAKKKELLDRLR